LRQAYAAPCEQAPGHDRSESAIRRSGICPVAPARGRGASETGTEYSHGPIPVPSSLVHARAPCRSRPTVVIFRRAAKGLDSDYPSDIRIPGIEDTDEAYDALNSALAVNFNTIHAVRNGKITRDPCRRTLSTSNDDIAEDCGPVSANGAGEK
jgi:hypothetical protein